MSIDQVCSRGRGQRGGAVEGVGVLGRPAGDPLLLEPVERGLLGYDRARRGDSRVRGRDLGRHAPHPRKRRQRDSARAGERRARSIREASVDALRVLLNVIWLVLQGWILALAYLLAGLDRLPARS